MACHLIKRFLSYWSIEEDCSLLSLKQLTLISYGDCTNVIKNGLNLPPSGRDSLEVHGTDHPEPELHDEGRPPVPHHVHRHHVGLRLRRGLHLQHGLR